MYIVNEATAKYSGKKTVDIGLGILEDPGEYLAAVSMSSTNNSSSRCSIYDAVTRKINDNSVELISKSFNKNLASALFKVTVEEGESTQLIFEGKAPMASVGDIYGIVVKGV